MLVKIMPLTLKKLRFEKFRTSCDCNARQITFHRTFFAQQKTDLEQFDSFYPHLLQDLTCNKSLPEESNESLRKVIEYNLTGGKKIRGLMVLAAYKSLSKQVTQDGMKKAVVAGWCTELLHTNFLMIDDIYDKSETRRNKMCWYKHNNLGNAAFYDACILKYGIFTLFKKYFNHEPYYLDILDLFSFVEQQTILGEHLDLSCMVDDEVQMPRLADFTMERYVGLCKGKAGYPTYYLPIMIAMQMAGITESELLSLVEPILIDLGLLYQIQDDFLDCYGDPKVLGKIPTDIIDGKCTWLIIKALQKANSQQMKVLKECYGRPGIAEEHAIKKVYDELGVKAACENFQETFISDLICRTKQLPPSISQELFTNLVMKLRNRNR